MAQKAVRRTKPRARIVRKRRCWKNGLSQQRKRTTAPTMGAPAMSNVIGSMRKNVGEEWRFSKSIV
jgi:hypothetical protein